MPREPSVDDLTARLDASDPEARLLSRRDVVCSEIEAAVRLFFDESPPAPVAVLVGAATDVLFGLAGGKAGSATKADMRRYLRGALPPGEADEVIRFVELPYNFFKHAARDPHKALPFNSKVTEVWLYRAIVDFGHQFGELTHVMLVHNGWHAARYPDRVPELALVMEATFPQFRGLDQLPERAALKIGRDLLPSPIPGQTSAPAQFGPARP